MPIDILPEDEFTIVATVEQMSLVYKLATEQIRLEKEVAVKESELKELKKELVKIEQGSLPDAVYQTGLSEVKTKQGDSITIKEDISVSLPKAKMGEIADWLDENGHSDIITGKVYVDLPRNSHNERQAAIQALVDAGLEPVEETNINTATLKSILRDHLKNGDNINLADFGGFAWRKAIIKRN